MLVKEADSGPSKRAPANASPNAPPAEFTPAASLTRSSAIGASVRLLSWETSRPSPDPAIIKGTARYQPEVARGTIGSMAVLPAGERGNPGPMRVARGRLPPLL